MVELSMTELQKAAPRAAENTSKPDAVSAKQASEAAKAVKQKAAEASKTVKEAQKAANKADQEKLQDVISERQKDALKEAFSGLDDAMSKFNKAISFAVFEESGELYAQVVNTETKEVLKTFPSEEMLEVMNRISDSIGMLIDEQG